MAEGFKDADFGVELKKRRVEKIRGPAEAMTASPVALITGAAARIGAATRTLLHENGYRVIIHYNNSIENANALANSLNNKRENSACIPGKPT